MRFKRLIPLMVMFFVVVSLMGGIPSQAQAKDKTIKLTYAFFAPARTFPGRQMSTWAEEIDPAKFGYIMGPQDQVIYYQIKAGVPPWDCSSATFIGGTYQR